MTEGSSDFRLFGTSKQTDMLLLIGLLEETYASELARLLNVHLGTVQNYVQAMELCGILATRAIGKERRISINPRFYARKELQALISKLVEVRPDIMKSAASLRRRPRRMGKPLELVDPDLRRGEV